MRGINSPRKGPLTRKMLTPAKFYKRLENSTWWRHQMETLSVLLAIFVWNSPVPVKSPHKGQWRGALMFSLICVWINGWVNSGEAGDLRRYRAHYEVIVMNHRSHAFGTFFMITLWRARVKHEIRPTWRNGSMDFIIVTWKYHFHRTQAAQNVIVELRRSS